MNLYKIPFCIPFSLCSFKCILTEVSCSNEKVLCFLQDHGVLIRRLICPGPAIKGQRRFGCGKEMILKSTKDTKDGLVWRCRKIHKADDSGQKKVTKDVKITVRHMSWLVDAQIPLTSVIELMYLWSQGFTINEIKHELKLSHKTVIEWSIFFRESCFTVMIEHSQPIGGNGIEVEIDESKFG